MTRAPTASGRDGTGEGHVARSVAVLVLLGFLMAACNAGREEACGMLEELPPRIDEVTVGQVEELSEAALGSERARIRAIGEQLAETLGRREALERLAPGASLDVLEVDLERLREACEDLEEAAP
jgi:hypothetical protein